MDDLSLALDMRRAVANYTANERSIAVDAGEVEDLPNVIPRLWLVELGSGHALGLLGLLPACAGATYRDWIAGKRVEASPRVCGGNQVESVRLRQYQGFSPRVRGQLPISAPGLPGVRLLPACAEHRHPRWRKTTCAGSIPACGGYPQTVSSAGAAVSGGPHRVGDFRAGPQSRAPRLSRRRDGVHGAGGEQDVPRGRGGRRVGRVGV